VKDDQFFSFFPSNGAPLEWNWQGKTKVLGEKHVPVPLCPPQIPRGVNRDRTRASATNRLSHCTTLLTTSVSTRWHKHRRQHMIVTVQLTAFLLLHFCIRRACAATSLPRVLCVEHSLQGLCHVSFVLVADTNVMYLAHCNAMYVLPTSQKT
jgi:hypothetical protein